MSVQQAADGQPNRAEVYLHTEHRVGRIDERIFSGFLEHMGRAVYEGVYDPGNPLSDEQGFRTDVLDTLRQLRMPMVRYPGGNFVSNHDWRHAVGPRDQRPVRPDFAWRSIETHQFGTDEFMDWCKELGTEPMIAVNLGTGTPADAAALLEYCNLPAGTSYADQRVANGHAEPYGVKLWCLGNEMDGFWQAGHVPAQTYAERARVASSLMKGLDQTIQTVVCGSSTRLLPSYPEWDLTVLDHCWDTIDFIATHKYAENHGNDTATFLAEGVEVDSILKDYRGLLIAAKARKRGFNDVYVSFDEWNVWYRATGMDGGFEQAPHLLEEVYNVEDALVCAQYLNAFMRNADIVRSACLAQVVNVIAPVMTRPDGLLIQTIFWPFKMIRDSATGWSLRAAVNAPEMFCNRGLVPVIDVAATYDDSDPAAVTASVSVVNRDPNNSTEVSIDFAGAPVQLVGSRLLTGDPKAQNDWDTPNAVAPTDAQADVDEKGRVRVTLPGPSHAVLSFRGGSATR